MGKKTYGTGKVSGSACHGREEARLTETIANEKRLFLPLLQVGFRVHRDLWFADGENTSVSDQCYKRDIFSVGGYQKITRTISFRCTHRGYYEMDEVELVTRVSADDPEVLRNVGKPGFFLCVSPAGGQ
ncbi:MAG: hypothetical protein ACLRT5_06245 [Lachnospiraceae bacterium]